MAGNSKRRRRDHARSRGQPDRRLRRSAAASGLEGKGPTPKADRAASQPQGAQDAAKAADEASARPAGHGAPASAGDAASSEWVAGRNPVSRRCARRSPRPRCTSPSGIDTRRPGARGAASSPPTSGIPLLEAPRTELDRITDGAVHQGLALQVPPYEYAHPDDLLAARARGAARRRCIVALDGVTDPRNLGAVVRSARRVRRARRRRARAPRGRHDGVGVEDLGRCGRPGAGRPGHQPDPAAEGVQGRRADRRRPRRRRRRRRSPTSTSPTDPLVLVVGSEGKGLSRLVARDLRRPGVDPDGVDARSRSTPASPPASRSTRSTSGGHRPGRRRRTRRKTGLKGAQRSLTGRHCVPVR